MPSDYYIGLMSGTSGDAVDAVLTEIIAGQTRLIDCIQQPIPDKLKHMLQQLVHAGDRASLGTSAELDIEMGHLFAETVLDLLQRTDLPAEHIHAIGSHGQTVFHHPSGQSRYTIQVADPNTIAERTGITTIADFRRRDMACGGQGAPLVPAFHQQQFRSGNETRVVVNIGGIANITVLPADIEQDVIGFDTGPGNTLMDEWCRQELGSDMDTNGQLASQGQCHSALLKRLLSDRYFTRPAPKSSGREYFNLNWLGSYLQDETLSSADMLATLTELTAVTIDQAIKRYAPGCQRILVCGGGSHNTVLMQRLAAHADPIAVEDTSAFGIDPDWVEAMAFAWLAYRTTHHLSGNLPAVTGASHEVILGGLYPGRPATDDNP